MSEAIVEVKKSESEKAVALFGSEGDLTALYNLCRKHAPWAINMKDEEIKGVVLRVNGMGYNPVNADEIQIFPDSRGVIQAQPSYKFMVKFVERFHGSHTEPKYHRLTADELEDEGLPEDAIALRCSFVMHSEQKLMIQMVESGIYTTAEAREMYEITGLGSASSQEYNAKSAKGVEYFAPKGRSKLWKVKKRALIDAYRHKFGVPGNAEVAEIRHELGFDQMTAEDWKHSFEIVKDVSPEARAALAQDHAIRRTAPALTVEEKKDGVDALYGDGASDNVIVDAEVEGVEVISTITGEVVDVIDPETGETLEEFFSEDDDVVGAEETEEPPFTLEDAYKLKNAKFVNYADMSTNRLKTIMKTYEKMTKELNAEQAKHREAVRLILEYRESL
jgi:hypothetical protein